MIPVGLGAVGAAAGASGGGTALLASAPSWLTPLAGAAGALGGGAPPSSSATQGDQYASMNSPFMVGGGGGAQGEMVRMIVMGVVALAGIGVALAVARR